MTPSSRSGVRSKNRSSGPQRRAHDMAAWSCRAESVRAASLNVLHSSSLASSKSRSSHRASSSSRSTSASPGRSRFVLSSTRVAAMSRNSVATSRSRVSMLRQLDRGRRRRWQPVRPRRGPPAHAGSGATAGRMAPRTRGSGRHRARDHRSVLVPLRLTPMSFAPPTPGPRSDDNRSGALRTGLTGSCPGPGWPLCTIGPVARVFSGIQPTGDLHLGNLLGAVRNWVIDQHANDSVFCIVDLHAITVPKEPGEVGAATLELAQVLIACGLDPQVCTLFAQSHVPQHTELAWVLQCNTGLRGADPHDTVQGQVRRARRSSSPPGCSPTRRCRPPTSSCTTRIGCRSATTSASTSS